MTSQAHAVFQHLCACLATDPAVQRPAEAQLLAWETQAGFCSALAVSPHTRKAQRSALCMRVWCDNAHKHGTDSRLSFH